MKMKTNASGSLFWLGILVGLILPAVTVEANPIAIPEKSITPEISFLIVSSLLLEVICICLFLRRSRHPRFFILWLVTMHVLTYPGFLGLLWLLQAMRPAFAAAIGEGMVVVVEGLFIYGLCRWLAAAKSSFPRPSLIKCWLASLLGNLCSALAFPVLLAISERFGLP